MKMMTWSLRAEELNEMKRFIIFLSVLRPINKLGKRFAFRSYWREFILITIVIKFLHANKLRHNIKLRSLVLLNKCFSFTNFFQHDSSVSLVQNSTKYRDFGME